MVEQIKSHIQMPKLLLKRFQNKSQYFYYYDVKRKWVGNHGSANSINTKLGYYSIKAEHYLRDNIETPFSNILSCIEQIDFNKDYFSFNSTFQSIVLDFVYSLIARDPLVHEDILKNSVYAQFLPVVMQHDFAAIEGTNIGRKNNMFNDYTITFILNKTEIPFVLAVSGLYSFSLNNYTCVNLPISPYMSVCLVNKNYKKIIGSDGTISMFWVEDKEKIECLNNAAFMSQLEQNWGYIICPEREEIDRLKTKFIR